MSVNLNMKFLIFPKNVYIYNTELVAILQAYSIEFEVVLKAPFKFFLKSQLEVNGNKSPSTKEVSNLPYNCMYLEILYYSYKFYGTCRFKSSAKICSSQNSWPATSHVVLFTSILSFLSYFPFRRSLCPRARSRPSAQETLV